MIKADLAVEFSKISSSTPRFFQSPGRINLIGDHTDYNDGFVMPAAINRYAYMAVSFNDKTELNLRAVDFNQNETHSIRQLTRNEQGGWANYFIGIMSIFNSRGIELKGVDCAFSSDVPVGAGLSSSAALTCCFAFALNELFHANFTLEELVDIAQETEHEFALVKCGNMDQTASLFGQKGQAMMFDCRSRNIAYCPLELADYAVLLVDTKVKHTLADTAYNQRREECEVGVDIIHSEFQYVASLRDVTMEMLASVHMPKKVLNRCEFVVEENARVQTAAASLKRADLKLLGTLIWGSHEGLSNKYEVSCVELDFIVGQAKQQDDILGARMMGGGFGGCCLVLIKKAQIENFKISMLADYANEFGRNPAFYEFEIADGTKELT